MSTPQQKPSDSPDVAAGAVTHRDRPATPTIHQLVEEIARALVDDQEQVQVEALEKGDCTTLRLHVSDRDVGKIIGKQGRTAHSLRTILSAVSMKYHHRYSLDIVERAQLAEEHHEDGH